MDIYLYPTVSSPSPSYNYITWTLPNGLVPSSAVPLLPSCLLVAFAHVTSWPLRLLLCFAIGRASQDGSFLFSSFDVRRPRNFLRKYNRLYLQPVYHGLGDTGCTSSHAHSYLDF